MQSNEQKSSPTYQVPLIDVFIAFARALDLVPNAQRTHHLQTALLSFLIAQKIGLSQEITKDLILSALVHDLGLTIEEKEIPYEFLQPNSIPGWSQYRHAFLGYIFLSENPLLREIAPNMEDIILYHHIQWRMIKEPNPSILPPVLITRPLPEKGVLLSSFIIHLSGLVSRAIDTKRPILVQRKEIIKKVKLLSGSVFPPEVAEAFIEVANIEAIWLELHSPMLCHTIRRSFPFPNFILNSEKLLSLAQLACDIIDFHSTSTAVHSMGVAAVVEGLAEALKLSSEAKDRLLVASYLHDLGKLAMPREMLEKDGELTEEERDLMKAHPFYTYDILSAVRGLEKESKWAGFHHERLDGSGYPFHLKGDEIPFEARIVAVADVFSALREHRPYRPVMPRRKMIRILRDGARKGKMDADVVEVLIRNYDEIEARLLDRQFTAMQRYRNIIEKCFNLLTPSWVLTKK
ncbi:HD domain-containing protein [bacterium]|nr:HD domain-containing protein [bacterium]